VDLGKLLKTTLFIAHPEKELNLDEEASVYTSSEEAVKDLCANYVTEIILLKTRPITEIQDELWPEEDKSESAEEAADGG
jgi:hypothetical protein